VEKSETRHPILNGATERAGTAPQRRSFVLRVWLDASGELRGYLCDVRADVRLPFREPSEIATLVRSMFGQQDSQQSD